MKGIMRRDLQEDPTLTCVELHRLHQWLGIGPASSGPNAAPGSPPGQVAELSGEFGSGEGRWDWNDPQPSTALNPAAESFEPSVRASKQGGTSESPVDDKS